MSGTPRTIFTYTKKEKFCFYIAFTASKEKDPDDFKIGSAFTESALWMPYTDPHAK